jgi:hypothetical protein
MLTEQLEEAGPTETKKSKVLGKMTKGKFLDLLKGQNVSIDSTKIKTEIKEVSEIVSNSTNIFFYICLRVISLYLYSGIGKNFLSKRLWPLT